MSHDTFSRSTGPWKRVRTDTLGYITAVTVAPKEPQDCKDGELTVANMSVCTVCVTTLISRIINVQYMMAG